MERTSWLLFLLLLATISQPSLSSGGSALENPFPLGTIGCLASDVCGPGEVCKDDLLFGSCRDIYEVHRSRGRSHFGAEKFRLEASEIEELEETIWSLIQDGFTWQDAYTQCTLQNLLVAFQQGGRFSARLCEDALGVSLPSSSSWTEEAKADVAAVLGELLQPSQPGMSFNSEPSSLLPASYPRLAQLAEDRRVQDDLPGDEVYRSDMYPMQDNSGYEAGSYGDGDIERLDSNKRDEFVQVHKYFDQSKGQLKRDPFLSKEMDPYNFLTAFPQQAIQVQSSDGAADGDDVPYVPVAADMEQLPVEGVKEEGEEFFDLPPDQGEVPAAQGSDTGHEELGLPPEIAPGGEAAEGEDQEEEPLTLSPRDKSTLEQLLQGSVEPDELPVDQMKRLSRFIETMMSTLEMRGTEHLDDVEVADEGPADTPPAEHNPIATQQAASRSEDDSTENGVGEEEGQGMGLVLPALHQDTDSDKEDVDVDLDKKSPSDGEDSSKKPSSKAVVKTGYTYIRLNNKVDEEEAARFVHNLTQMLHVPPGVAKLDEVDGDQLILKLTPDSQWNSSKLAQEAKDHSVALARSTGLKVLDAGIGKGVTVEVQKKDGEQIVLTFILVGSIAGVVLAVIIIYLIKRHRRSQEKLAQLATTGDGNEASKDYQDLCRQRMQSKASEKPEPLHAASRIGSVSESQVRSPSSRSSTSSWSEEPAATNMDISTGHVVLSYMEDHLKNGDRLEQEWEALAAYQADPCTTSIATDQANARKNRYSDVLPYDHSRVVLSASTNVSNSDYVNASFITDHDPRNPAYICTQGPLPHTVADFWQMVWEQGSVVIVMLTKLTENGAAMCHRYWPEEGSDLYHIYEVHLVSEHIWCDDYLVRSFYLKNLQTNETRTVTQFHFLTWPHMNVPPSMKALLDFRRKVNKSFRGGSCPIVLHCNDGCGRSGTYCLVDMVLNRMAKGAKEIDMAATLEHIRDQRMNMVQSKEQFQFALSAVAEEVNAILKAMPQ